MRKSVRDFVARVIDPVADKMIEDRRVPRDVWRKAGDSGLLGLQVPERYGGGGADDYRFTALLLEELAGSSAALASAFAIHCDVVAPYLVDLTTEEQKQRWLPKLCSGEMITALAMTEPSGGSDLAALKSTATRSGDEWILNGSKTFITNGYHADLVVVAARTSPEKRAKGITLFAVETGMPGFERGRKLDKVGQPEADTAELFFSDVRIPAANVIGEVDRGFVRMMERLSQERLGGAVANIAHAVPILQETVAYAKQRKVFGAPIGSMQWNKFLIADLVTRAEVTQVYVDTCVAAHTDGTLSPVDAAKAKWWSAQVQNDILDACVQLHDGYGYMTEYRAARAWMDARVTKIWAGSNEIMKELIGRDLGL
jgi:long-chain-acyl-CoA dehydrogenase